MILIESGDSHEAGLWAMALFAARLARAGYQPVIQAPAPGPDRAAAVPDRGLRHALLPFLRDADDLRPQAVIVIAADRLDAEAVARLPQTPGAGRLPVLVLGRFADAQARIGAAARIGYLLSHEARIVDTGPAQAAGLFAAARYPQLGAPGPSAPRNGPATRLWLLALTDAALTPDVQRMAEILHHQPDLRVGLVVTEREQARLSSGRRHGPEVMAWGELAPATLARCAEAAVVLPLGEAAVGPGGADRAEPASPVVEQAAALLTDLLWQGGAAIDCTEDGLLTATGAPVLQGPRDIAALDPYLRGTVLPNLTQIAQTVAASRWRAAQHLAPVLDALAAAGIAPRPRVATAASPRQARGRDRPPRALFLPTNGSGLGHAQRCTLVADALDRPAVFAAFPSCIPMISSRGFACLPLVQRSDLHADPRANDLLNAARLPRVVAPGDVLVFDGANVFDSVFRVIRDRDLRAVWLRRGLWQPSQRGKPYLHREPAFDRVIVPGEAFDELNDALTFGRHVHPVGPIVRALPLNEGERATLRHRLLAHFGAGPADRIVVSMLGGGVAADRSAQTLALAGVLEARGDVLHLVVVWPGAAVAPGLAAHARSHAVQTHDAGRLAQAADLVVTAAGYNSFHEVLYHATPAIFIPQQAPIMDDQTRRARAAADRGLADCVAAHELLLLERKLSACLDGGRADDLRRALAAAALPQTGTVAAAALIRAEIDR